MNSQAFLMLQGEHAPFSPSQPVWLNYNDDELLDSFKNKKRSDIGTELHEWASGQIKLMQNVSYGRDVEKGLRYHIYKKYENAPDYRDVLLLSMTFLPTDVYGTVKAFVNDCIGYGMLSEQKVQYSNLFFGTADAIRYTNNSLKVFDLKTGSRPAKIDQLYVYASLYCLEHGIKPLDIETEVRIYQNNDVVVNVPDPPLINECMRLIVHKDKVITKFLEGMK